MSNVGGQGDRDVGVNDQQFSKRKGMTMRRAMVWMLAMLAVSSMVIQLRQGISEVMVLNTMARGNGYGHQIAQQLQLADGLRANEKSMHRILESMRAKGYVTVTGQREQAQAHSSYYSLTRRGKQRVAAVDRLVSAHFPGDELVEHVPGVSGLCLTHLEESPR